MFRLRIPILIALAMCASLAAAQVKVAHISDTHFRSPEARNPAENLRKTVELVNARKPDVVLVTGDIAENPEGWQEARATLRALKAPVYYIPGNHDVHSDDLDRYRRYFGKDYYKIRVKHVTFVAINSQLLGNFDDFNTADLQPLSPEAQRESERMLEWLQGLAKAEPDSVVVGFQHVPPVRATLEGTSFPADPKPYWVVNDPYRARQLKLLKDIGIKHMFVGHWHRGMVFDAEGITWHVAPSTSRLLWGGSYGFAMHTISQDGDVKTEFVDIGQPAPLANTASAGE
jgi:3',5'-cyclic AMP phosphodiesterase CpdA